MTSQNYRGFIRPLSSENTEKSLSAYPLSEQKEIVIGRDPSCDIALDPDRYLMVSRHHAKFRPFYIPENGLLRWEICDLNSINGTYINGRSLHGCYKLQGGDCIELGQNGPQFIFEYQLTTPLLSSPNNPNYSHPSTPDSVTFTQLFPLASTGRSLTQKAYFIPAVVTVIFVVLMFAAVGEAKAFNFLIATYLTVATSYFVYQLCGKPKPWWVLAGCAGLTSLIIVSPVLPLFMIIFREILPGNLPNEGENINFINLLIRMFFGAGLMEELIKAVPLFAAYFIGSLLHSPWREKVGIWEPLDGILLGTASAVGFTFVETLGQYVPNIISTGSIPTGDGSGQLLGLQLLIPRILGSLAGHIAYSGYFGYFIGLSVLKPKKALQILAVGCICAASLHALWNAMGFVSVVLLVLIGIASYAFLAAAILKARALSPTRSQNFATRFFGH